MKKLRIVVASMVGAACLVGTVPASTAGTITAGPLTITCQQNPSYCYVVGQSGPIVGEAVASPRGDAVILCVSKLFFCDQALGYVVVQPYVIFAEGGIAGLGGAQLVIAARFVRLILGTSGGYLVQLVANNGAEGLILITPGVHKCLVINGLTISAPPC